MAAITATHLITAVGAGASSFNTASVTPSANKLVLVTVGSRLSGGSPNEPTLSGNGLTYVSVATQTRIENRVTVFRAMGASPSAGAITISFGGQTQSQAGWSVSEYTNMDTGGTNGSGAVVQSGGASSGTSATYTVTLAAFGDVNNATYGGSWFATGGTPSMTPGSGFTELGEAGDAINVVQSEFKDTNDTTVDATCSSADGGAGIGIEIKNATQSAVAVPFLSLLGVGT